MTGTCSDGLFHIADRAFEHGADIIGLQREPHLFAEFVDTVRRRPTNILLKGSQRVGAVLVSGWPILDGVCGLMHQIVD